jgi:hypothetical protein
VEELSQEGGLFPGIFPQAAGGRHGFRPRTTARKRSILNRQGFRRPPNAPAMPQESWSFGVTDYARLANNAEPPQNSLKT